MNNPMEDKATDTYRVVFWGEVARGQQRPQVALAFAKKFRIQSRRQLEQLFSGKVITLKRNLPLTEAHRYIAAIQSLGGICRMERETNNQFFFDNEVKERNTVSFLQNDVDMEALALAPKE